MQLGGLCLHHLGVSHLLCIYMWHPMSWQHLDLVRICHVAEASRVLRPMSWHRILCRIIAAKMLRPMSWHCSAATCTSSLCNRTSSSGLSLACQNASMLVGDVSLTLCTYVLACLRELTGHVLGPMLWRTRVGPNPG